MATVALAVIDGVRLLNIAGPVEIFGENRSNLVDPWYRFIVCGSSAAHVSDWFHPHAPRDWNEFAAADIVIVPAIPDVAEPPPPEVVDAVATARQRGARVVAIGSGVFVLAAAGLLNGHRATTDVALTGILAARYPRIDVDPNALFVDDGPVLTSAGKTAGLQLCVAIVRADHGPAVADALAGNLGLPVDREARLSTFETEDLILSQLVPWVTENLDQPFTVTDLARQANMSTRNLTRRFNALAGVTPLQWLLNRRLSRAQELLETTNDSVEHIADQTGIGTAATLRRHFNRTVGVPPEVYRRTFRTC